MCGVGTVTHNLMSVLEGLYALEFLPPEPWAATYVLRGLTDPDPETRELAVSIAATGDPDTWMTALTAFVDAEPEPHLRRFARLVIDEHRCLSITSVAC